MITDASPGHLYARRAARALAVRFARKYMVSPRLARQTTMDLLAPAAISGIVPGGGRDLAYPKPLGGLLWRFDRNRSVPVHASLAIHFTPVAARFH